MSAIPHAGTTLETSPDDTTYTAVAQLISITPPGTEREAVETSDLAAGAKTFRGSKKYDAGELELAITYDPKLASHATLEGLRTSGNTIYWRITLNDMDTTATIAKFSGFVTGFEVDEVNRDDEDNVTATLTVKVTGAITLTPGTSS
ncbi:phage tail tube protein [Tautonia plasticadhaerens]|uniref:Phage major tail protein 2 n=1 Tax=Tautonia plasticadhaerens TaxID=2527974 RepID=A0A518GZJ9_9BACT|nr:phage tail tube protein [Tautonia plasticadhaerens]QDV34014.1 hypothetical protein ElP_18950 [Tautonia plasticadhaerens]